VYPDGRGGDVTPKALLLFIAGIAYWLFYLLIDEAGAATASVITYVMPVIALFLGVGLHGRTRA
jgi:drug/metabolite transporter (DMT)-like permease